MIFTGIVEEKARVAACQGTDAGVVLEVEAVATRPGLRVGDSIAVNGACLTAEDVSREAFTATVVPETLRRTNLGDVASGQCVNLERPLRADSRLEGHIVLGHVDAAVPVVSVQQGAEGRRMTVLVGGGLSRFAVEKGSVTLDGVSLTVAAVSDEGEDSLVEVALVPHTLRATTLGDRCVDDRVNLEVDILAKYAARFWERAGGKGT